MCLIFLSLLPIFKYLFNGKYAVLSFNCDLCICSSYCLYPAGLKGVHSITSYFRKATIRHYKVLLTLKRPQSGVTMCQ